MLAFPPFEQNDPAASGATMRLAGGGQFNQTVWRVETSGDHTGLEAQLLTLHEWSHNELNNVSVYGALLTAFAQLARHTRTDRERHRDTLYALAERSRRAHEVYATWYSTDMFLLRAGLDEFLALYPPEYREYFAAGATLVEGIGSPFLRQQAFLCAVRMCFSGAEFASHGRDLAAFDPERVRAELYPSCVLDLLAEVVPVGFFAEQLDAFLHTGHPPGVADAIAAACAERRRDADFFGSLPAAQADAATMELHRWLHGALADRLAAYGAACVPYGAHLEFIAAIVSQLGRLCDAATLTHPLVSNAQPHDHAANLLLHMENEVLNVRAEPLPCVLWPMADVPRERWPHLATGEPAHFFFRVRHASQLLAQHRFPEDQRRRLQAMAGPLVLLRRRGRRDGQVECETLLFERPEELAEFRRATAAVPAFASIAMSALGDSAWCERWLDTATRGVTGTILFDQSVFHTLKDGWPGYVGVRYGKGILHTGETDYVFLTFLAESADGTYALYLAPCSELFARAVVAFIEAKLPTTRFVRDEGFLSELSWLLPPVVSHLLAEEHFFSFNQIRSV